MMDNDSRFSTLKFEQHTQIKLTCWNIEIEQYLDYEHGRAVAYSIEDNKVAAQ